MKYLVCLLLGYFLGSINPAYFLGKWKGFDIREHGSGNAGASNALMLLGKYKGIFCAFFDVIKAFAVILLTSWMFPDLRYGFVITGVSCVLGHIFPFYMGFRGGKGLACLGGMVLAFDLWVFVLMLIGAVILVLLTGYICFVPMAASVVFPLIYGWLQKDFLGALILSVLIPIIFCKHRVNLRRIREGKEMRISFLWNQEDELRRLDLQEEKEQI